MKKATTKKEEVKFIKQVSKKSKNDVMFIKKVPIHPQNRLKNLAAMDEKVEFIKQVPLHLRDRLKRLKNRPKKNINKMKNINAQIKIAAHNTITPIR